MNAAVGDTLTVKAVHQGETERHGTVLEVHGHDGAPPYLVRWEDGHESVFFPAAGTMVEHHPAPSR